MATRSPVRKIVGPDRLKQLSKKADGPAWLFFILHLLVTAVTGGLIALAQGTYWIIPALFLHGAVLVHWFAPLHEAIHGTAFKSKALNDALAWFSGLVIVINPRHFTLEHPAHHFHTNDPEKDPELIPHSASVSGYLWYATAIPYFISNGKALLHYAFGGGNAEERDYIPDDKLAWVQKGARWMVLTYLLLALLSWWAGSWAVLLYWFLPRLLGEPLMRIIRMSEHGGRPLVPDMLENTRSVEAVWPLRLLAWNMCYHTEHHALPSVPFHQLPALHKVLKPHCAAVSPNYRQATREIILAARARGQ